jgi:hypothetical protein
VISKHVLYAALLLCLLLQRIEMLHGEIITRVAGLEFEEPHSLRDEGWTLEQLARSSGRQE